MKAIKLIRLFYQVCDWYNEDLAWNVQRFSKNGLKGHITDQELITIYLFCVIEEQKTSIKSMYAHIRDYWLGWFILPTYSAFNDRLNRLNAVFPDLIALLLKKSPIEEDLKLVLIGDSCPVVTCSGKRTGKVAKNITDKGRCASKDMWYHGVKLHMLSHKIPKKLPFPQFLGITKASVHDSVPMRELLVNLKNADVYLDKAYCDVALEEIMENNQSKLITPIKGKKGQMEEQKQRDSAYNQVVGTAIAKVRQPVESFFNWINEKTGLQNASKARSENGLLLHIFGKIAAAIILLMGGIEKLNP
jgi:Transposase DDE domain